MSLFVVSILKKVDIVVVNATIVLVATIEFWNILSPKVRTQLLFIVFSSIHVSQQICNGYARKGPSCQEHVNPTMGKEL